jgi:ADP-ribose diphosphatase
VPVAEFEALIQGGHIKDSATLSAYCLLRMQRRIPGL